MLFITDETPDLINHSAGAYHPDADGICFFVGREIGLTGDQPRSCVSIEIEIFGVRLISPLVTIKEQVVMVMSDNQLDKLIFPVGIEVI